MKKLLFALMLFAAIPSLVVLSSSSAYAFSGGKGGTKIPASQVPRPVKKTFRADFPTATQVEWEFSTVYYGGNTYTASFNNNGQKWEATFSADGALLTAAPKA